MKTCIVNFADGVFLKGQERLKKTITTAGFESDFIGFSELLPGWPEHSQVPWGFKVYAIEEAYKRGYDQVLWIDAAGMARKNLQPLFDIMARDGVFVASRYAASVGEWSSDYALDALGITREQAFHIPEISGFSIGVNFAHEKGKEFFAQWKKYAEDGISFLGVYAPLTIKDSMNNDTLLLSKDSRVRGHRHDQTVASVVAHRIGIHPTTKYIFDLTSESQNGEKYARYIPSGAILIHNRDIKSDSYLQDLSLYKTSPYSIFRSGIRWVKDLIKWHYMYRKKYNV